MVTEIGVAGAETKAGGTGRARGAQTFSGSRATTGNSRGFRVETAFFKAAPEFDAAGAVRLDLIGPGRVLLNVDLPAETEGDDSVIGAWLSFIEADIVANPQHLVPLTGEELGSYEALVEGVAVTDDDTIPDDVTF